MLNWCIFSILAANESHGIALKIPVVWSSPQSNAIRTSGDGAWVSACVKTPQKILMCSQLSDLCQIHPLSRLWLYVKYHIINPVRCRFLYIVSHFKFAFSFKSQRVRGCLSTSELAFPIRSQGLHSWPRSFWKWISSS